MVEFLECACRRRGRRPLWRILQVPPHCYPPSSFRIWTSAFFFPAITSFSSFFASVPADLLFLLRHRLGGTVLTVRFIPYPFVPVFPWFRAHFFRRVDLVKLLQQFTPSLVLRFCWMGLTQPFACCMFTLKLCKSSAAFFCPKKHLFFSVYIVESCCPLAVLPKFCYAQWKHWFFSTLPQVTSSISLE